MHDNYFPIFVGILLVAGAIRQSYRKNRIELGSTRFWQIVAKVENPIIIVTMSGLFRRQPCYLFPWHGIIFYTRSRPEDLPPGVSLVPAEEAGD